MEKFQNHSVGIVTSVSFSMEELTTLFDIKYGAPQICTEIKNIDIDEQTLKDVMIFVKKAERIAKTIIETLQKEEEEE